MAVMDSGPLAALGPGMTELSSQPRPGGLGFLLEAADLLVLHHGEPDIVEPVEQAIFAMWIDFEFHDAAVGTADFLLGILNLSF